MSGAITISIAARDDPGDRDRRRAPAGLVELERDEHADDAEDERRERS